MKYVALVLCILLAAASIVGAFNGKFDVLYITVPATVALAALYVLSQRSSQSINTFEQWLVSNRAQILQSGGLFENHKITRSTVLTRYLFVVSLVVVTFKFPSRLYIRDVEPTGLVAFVYTVASALLGWWGIPWGPIYTTQAIARNIAGGYAVTVGDLLDPPPEEQKKSMFGWYAVGALAVIAIVLFVAL